MSSFPRIRPTAALPVLLITVLLLLPSALFGQLATTGSVTGIVADATGAVIPHASVELTNGLTGISRKTVSNSVGSFAFASVEASTSYTVTASIAGFRPWQSQPFPLRPGDEIKFTDIKLTVGAETEQITVEATTSAVKDLDNGERADVIDAKEIETLSVVGRDATELVRMLPGFTMSSGANGVGNKAGFNSAVVGLSGATGSFSANGSGTNGISVVSDGVSLTDIASNSGTIQNVNIDAVSEMKVTTSEYSAEYSKGPGIVNVTGKSGTSAFHGTGFFYARDTNLNANDWYNNNLQQTRPEGRYLYPGGSLNGPVLLPLTSFNKNRNKLFFFVLFEYNNQLFSPETLGSWVPTKAERLGHFDQSSLDAQLCGARPDGAANPNAILPMCETENWLPNGNGVVNGDVSSYANSSGRALVNWLPLPNADPFTNASGFNYVKTVVQTQNGTEFHSKVDYHITPNDSLALGYNRQSQISQDPVNLGYVPTAAILYPGSVTTGDISTSLFASYTKVMGASLTNEFSAAMSFVSTPGNMGTPAAVDRFDMNSYNGGNGNYDYLGMYKNSGDYSVPALSPGTGMGYPSMLMPGGFYDNKVRMKKASPDISDVVTWMKGTHLFKFGIYAEKGYLNGLADYGAYPQGALDFNPGNAFFEYNQNQTQNGQGGSIGQTAQFTNCESSDPLGNNRLSGAAYLGVCMNPNALMYMGYADQYAQTNFSPTVDMEYTTYSGFVNDSWKVRSVTLNLGVRLEHIGGWNDRHGNGMATFSPSLYASQCTDLSGTTSARNCTSLNMPGLTWHGIDSHVANGVNWPSNILLSPRFALAWDVLGKGKTVIRGGWGVNRSQEEFNPYAMAAATAQGYKTSLLQNQLSFDTIDNQSPLNPPDFSAYTISSDDKNRPYHVAYNLTISQSMPWHSILEVAYVGGEGRNLSTYNNGYNSASNINLIPLGGLFGGPNTDPLNSLPPTLTASQGGTPTLGGLTTAEQDFFRPYPFYSNIYQLQHTYYSSNNSGQVSWNKQTGRITFGANYTFAKNLATAASWNNVVPNPFNLRDEYSPVPYDRTHVFNLHYEVDLGSHYHLGFKPLNELINGWQISGISTLQSGNPMASLQGGNFGFGYGLINAVQTYYEDQSGAQAQQQCINVYNIPADANGNHYCVTQLNPTVWLGTPDIQLMPTITCNPSGGPAKNQYINGACFGIPLPQTNGQLRPPYIRGPAYVDHDLTLLKNFDLGNKRNLQFRAAAFNFINHANVSFNNNSTQSDLTLAQQGGTAGQTLTQTDLTEKGFGIAGIKYSPWGGRLLELGVKLAF